MNNRKKLTRVAYGIYFFIVICFVLIRMLSAFGMLDFLGKWNSIIFTLVIQVVLLIGGSVFLFSYLTKNKIKDTLSFFSLKKISKKVFFISVILGIVVFFLNIFVSSFFNSIISFLGYSSSRVGVIISDYPIWLLIINLILTALLPGICEEVAHRGMILSATKKIGKGKAILISALLFGLLHLNIEQFFYATLIGLFLGFLTLATGSIFPAMIIHFMNNAMSVFLTFSSVKGLYLAKFFARIEIILQNNLFIGILFIILFVMLLLYLLLRLTFLLILNSIKDDVVKSKRNFEKIIQRKVYFKELSNFKGNEFERVEQKSLNSVELSKEELNDVFGIVEEKEEKLDNISKTLLILITVYLLVVTAFTFIWGII